LWYSDEHFAWLEAVLGFSPSPIDPAKQSWARLWAVIIGGTGIVSSLCMLVVVLIRRWRAQKSVKGQWYDHPDLKREDLYENRAESPPESERQVRPASFEAGGYSGEKPPPAHLVVPTSSPTAGTGNDRYEQ